jgi:hypothetical protein
MATISNYVRWATNTEELKRNLKEGLDSIEATRAGANKLVESLGGDKLIAAAHRYAAAVQEIGGVSNLTRQEQERVNAVVEKAIAKYEALGKTAPAALRELAAATKQTGTEWESFTKNFKVDTAIDQPLGTAKEAVNAFAATLGPTGIAALATAASIGAIGVAAFELAEKAAAVGGELNDMSEKTGMSVPALSKLSLAAQVAGSDLGRMSSALFMFEKNLGEGSKKFEEGLHRLGLTIEEVKAVGPDDWLALIAERLHHIEDPSERAAAAMELFGKQGRDIIPTLLKLSEAEQQVADIQPWTEEQAKQAEQFEMQMKSAKIHAESLGTAIGRDLIPWINELMPAVKWLASTIWVQTGIPNTFHDISNAVSLTSAAVDVLLGRLEQIPKVTGAAARGVQAWKDALKGREAGPLTLDPGEQKAAEQDLNETLKEQQRVQKAAREEAEKQLTAWQNLTGAGLALDGAVESEVRSWLALGKSQSDIAAAYGLTSQQVAAVATQMKFEQSVLDATTKAFGRQYAMLTPLTARFGELHDSLHLLIGDWNAFHGGITVAGDEMATVTIPMFSTLPNVVPQGTKAIQDATAATKTFGDTLTDAMGDVPNLLAAAFTGGGGLGGAIKALGTKVTAGLFGDKGAFSGITKAATGGLTRLFGDTIGGALGAAIPGIGALIGPGITALVGGFRKLFGGPSAEELKGRATIQDFEQQIASTLTATQKLEAGNDAWKQTTIAVRDAYLATGRSEAEAEAAVKRLWDSSKKGAAETQAAIDALNSVLQEQKQDQQDLEAAIQRYGFSIEQLGPAMQKQRLDDQAKQLLNDWRLLVGSGIAVVDVDQRMASSINDYLKLARQTGQEVPASFKPILQTMIDNGTLLDDNGQAVTDMGQLGVTWAESMTAGFDRVVNKLQQLLEGLGLVPKALDAIPDQKDITITPHLGIPEEPGGITGPRAEAASTGGFVTALGIQRFDVGGLVKASGWRAPWTFAKTGTDVVPAMLTPGELVLNEPQQAKIADLLAAGAAAAQGLLAGGKSGPAVVLQEKFEFSFDLRTIDGTDLQQTVETKLMPQIVSVIEDRRRGYAARLQQALGTP